MALPFAAAVLGSGGATILDYALGRPMNLWGRSIDATQTPAVRIDAYRANRGLPNVLPAPDAIVEAYRRGLLAEEDAQWGLESQGITWAREGPRVNQLSANSMHYYSRLWEQVGKMRRSRPDPATVSRLAVSGRISREDFLATSAGLDADWEALNLATSRAYQTPGLADLLQLRRLNKITQADFDQGARQLGWYQARAIEQQAAVVPLPDLGTLMRDSFLGLVNDETYARYANAMGHVDPAVRARVESAYYQIPSGPELVNLAVRDAWNEDVVRRWGYDAEFPEPLRFWMRAQGWDWGRAFTGQDGVRYPAIHWPQLLWRAHWAVLPPGLSYQLYRRLRPERIGRYAAQFPGIQPFTLADLQTVLRVHDYPPAARTWLAAINSQPLRMYTIRSAYRDNVRNRQWAMEQLKDSGYIEEDAAVILDTIDRQEALRETRWVDQLDLAARRATAKEIVAGYGDGYVSKELAVTRLTQLGLGAVPITRLLALEDSRIARQTLRALLQAIRRDFLAGTMSLAETQAALQSASVVPARQQWYLARWQALRGFERRALSSAQVSGLVAAGALDQQAGLARLANLNWVNPDASLLIGVAAAKAQARAQHVQDLLARKDAAARKVLEQAAKQAAAAVHAAQRSLRSNTSLPTLRHWYQLGLRSGPWVRARLLAQGYDTDSIDAYLSQWAMEEQPPLAVGSPDVAGIQRLLRRQTPLASVKRFLQWGKVTESWARRRLNDSGYAPETIAIYIADWLDRLPKGASGPAPEGSPIPPEG